MIDFQKYAEDITPEFAAMLLEKNYKNRPITHASVNQYAREMERGEFKQNGQPIIIGDEDYLLDGQHRLLAVIKSGVTIRSLIVINVCQKTFDTIDKHKRRTTGDSFSIAGHPNARSLAALVGRLTAYEAGRISQASNSIAMTDDEKEAYVQQHPGIHLAVTEAKNQYGKFRVLTEVDYGHMIYVFKKIDEDDTADFVDKLATGRNIGEARDSAILLLRKRLIDQLSNKAKLPVAEKMALVFRAWNYYRSGKQTKALRWHSDHPYPVPA